MLPSKEKIALVKKTIRMQEKRLGEKHISSRKNLNRILTGGAPKSWFDTGKIQESLGAVGDTLNTLGKWQNPYLDGNKNNTFCQSSYKEIYNISIAYSPLRLNAAEEGNTWTNTASWAAKGVTAMVSNLNTVKGNFKGMVCIDNWLYAILGTNLIRIHLEPAKYYLDQTVELVCTVEEWKDIESFELHKFKTQDKDGDHKLLVVTRGRTGLVITISNTKFSSQADDKENLSCASKSTETVEQYVPAKIDTPSNPMNYKFLWEKSEYKIKEHVNLRGSSTIVLEAHLVPLKPGTLLRIQDNYYTVSEVKTDNIKGNQYVLNKAIESLGEKQNGKFTFQGVTITSFGLVKETPCEKCVIKKADVKSVKKEGGGILLDMKTCKGVEKDSLVYYVGNGKPLYKLFGKVMSVGGTFSCALKIGPVYGNSTLSKTIWKNKSTDVDELFLKLSNLTVVPPDRTFKMEKLDKSKCDKATFHRVREFSGSGSSNESEKDQFVMVESESNVTSHFTHLDPPINDSVNQTKTFSKKEGHFLSVDKLSFVVRSPASKWGENYENLSNTARPSKEGEYAYALDKFEKESKLKKQYKLLFKDTSAESVHDFYPPAVIANNIKLKNDTSIIVEWGDLTDGVSPDSLEYWPKRMYLQADNMILRYDRVEKNNDETEGLITLPCQHTFRMSCLCNAVSLLGNPVCPVCKNISDRVTSVLQEHGLDPKKCFTEATGGGMHLKIIPYKTDDEHLKSCAATQNKLLKNTSDRKIELPPEEEVKAKAKKEFEDEAVRIKNALAEQEKKVKEEREKIETERDEWKKGKENFQSLWEEEKQEKERKSTELKTARDTLTQKETELKTARDTLTQKETELKTARDTLTQKETELQKLKEKETELKTARDTLTQKETELAQKLKEKETELAQKLKEIKQMEEANSSSSVSLRPPPPGTSPKESSSNVKS
jgi:hypothetical protein